MHFMMRTGEQVERIAQYKIKGIGCNDLRVIDSGYTEIPSGTVYMLMDNELSLNSL